MCISQDFDITESKTQIESPNDPLILQWEKREAILDEIITTESHYVEKLTLLVNEFVIPLTSMSDQGGFKQTKDQIKNLFKGINVIYMFHKTFLEKLKNTENHGKVFKECAQFLKMYTGNFVLFCIIFESHSSIY